jgi:hypothetical protein
MTGWCLIKSLLFGLFVDIEMWIHGEKTSDSRSAMLSFNFSTIILFANDLKVRMSENE